MTADTPPVRDGSRCDDLTEAECYAYDPRPGRSGGRLRFRCPRHGGDRQKSLSVDPTNGHFRCFQCKVWGTLVEHQRAKRPSQKVAQGGWRQTQASQPGWGETHQSHRAQFRPHSAVPRPEPMTPHDDAVKRSVSAWKAFPGSPAEAYARSRGVPDELAARICLGYWRGRWAGEDSEWLTFPLRCPVTGRPVGVYGRNLRTNDQARKGRVLGSRGVFGAAAAGPMPDDVVVVEGPFEAIAVMTGAGLPAARALCGSSLLPEWFDACLRVTLLLDDDGPGRDATDTSVRRLADRRRERGSGPQVLRLRANSLREKYQCKDLGEVLARGVSVRLNLPVPAGMDSAVVPPHVTPGNDSCEGKSPEALPKTQTFYESVCEIFGPVVELFDAPVLELFDAPDMPLCP